ncbi:MAG: sulfurtransferase [Chthonomonas sp.]|nr:sulfurtransferase [Chthonomonas sp.]
MADIPEISVQELSAEMAGPNPPRLIDVREPSETERGMLPGAEAIPLGQIADRLGELNPTDDLVIQCRSGGRSARAAEFLLGQGFQRVRNLKGGAIAWRAEIDPSFPDLG